MKIKLSVSNVVSWLLSILFVIAMMNTLAVIGVCREILGYLSSSVSCYLSSSVTNFVLSWTVIWTLFFGVRYVVRKRTKEKPTASEKAVKVQ